MAAHGLTLVEWISVLAIVSIMLGLTIPGIMSQVQKGQVVALAQAIPSYRKAVEAYYRDIGSVEPLNAAGVPAIEATGNSATATSLPARLTLDASDPLNTGANQWVRFRGPYLQYFDTANPPNLGAAIFMPAAVPVSYGTAVTATNIGWDLDTKDGLSDIPTGKTVVYLRLTGIQQGEFVQLNHMLDGGTSLAGSDPPLIDPSQPPVLASLLAMGGGPPPPPNTVIRGRLKYDAATQTALIYLAHNP